jgi:hypothetical protein
MCLKNMSINIAQLLFFNTVKQAITDESTPFQHSFKNNYEQFHENWRFHQSCERRKERCKRREGRGTSLNLSFWGVPLKNSLLPSVPCLDLIFLSFDAVLPEK